MTRLLALAVLCSLVATPGCMAMVLDKYRDAVMTDYLYFWVEDYEQPEIHVSWSHIHPTKPGGMKQEYWPTELTIRPGLAGCQFVEVYVNNPDQHLESRENAIGVFPAPSDATLFLDDRFPDCSVLLTFRKLQSKPYHALSAVTRDGVVAEFENGKRQFAWLLLMPLAAVMDGSVIAISFGGALATFGGGVGGVPGPR